MADINSQQATQITQFASTRMGQQVGDGECFTLVDQALRGAGARSAASYGTITPEANYVWGRAITVGQAQAGDVIQFSNYRYVKRVTTKIVRRDGSEEESFTEVEQSRPHHTAIVAIVEGQGAVTVLEQNVEGVRRVSGQGLFFTSLSAPPVISIDAGGTSTTVTTVITVGGQSRFYRPETP